MGPGAIAPDYRDGKLGRPLDITDKANVWVRKGCAYRIGRSCQGFRTTCSGGRRNQWLQMGTQDITLPHDLFGRTQ